MNNSFCQCIILALPTFFDMRTGLQVNRHVILKGAPFEESSSSTGQSMEFSQISYYWYQTVPDSGSICRPQISNCCVAVAAAIV
jgi:hypothetical protein